MTASLMAKGSGADPSGEAHLFRVRGERPRKRPV